MATKNQFKVYEDKIKYLQLYLEHMIKEKEEVMQRLEDMKVTAQQNKELLKEYINNITTKDQIVDKLQCTIENLQERIKSQEDYIRRTLSIKGIKSSPDKDVRRDNNFCLTNRNQAKSGLEDEANYSMTQRVSNNMKHSFNDIKEVFVKQKFILEELAFLKKDVQFIFDQSDQLNKKENKEKQQNDSFDSNTSTQSTKIRKISFNNKFEESDVQKLAHMAKNITSSDNQDTILFVDSDYRIFELVYRKDLNYNMLINSPENVVSIMKKHPEEEVLRIEFKRVEQESFENSDLDISRNTEFFNISQMMQDTQHELTDNSS